MANSVSSTSSSSSFPLLFLFLLSSQFYSISAVSNYSTTVKFLPGFHGPLPFHLETGYVKVGESSEDVELFYYFVKSERSPKDDPLMLWLTGGPGCSALSGLAFEIGPINFEIQEYNGSLPTLVLNPHSWTKVSSIIFVDLPANTGFSYAKPLIATQRSDSKQIQHALQFFRKWLIDHPEFISNSFYVGGDSYSGLIVPAVALGILKGNKDNVKPLINYQGYLLGNPVTNITDANYKIPFAHGMGLISDELYQSLKSSCGEEYQNVDPNNEMCIRYLAAFDKCVSGLNEGHILEPNCSSLSPKPKELMFGRLRSLHETSQSSLTSQPSLPPTACRSYESVLATYWANDDMVRRALGIRQGSIGKWERCLRTPYTRDIKSSFPFHVELSTKGYRALIYSGDHDFTIPFCGTQAWIRSLNYSIVDEWRPWLVQTQISGYTRMYSNGMTFATVKGAGHVALDQKPKECLAMFERWISHKLL